MKELIATACSTFRGDSGARWWELMLIVSEPVYEIQDGKLVSERRTETMRCVCDRVQLLALSEKLRDYARAEAEKPNPVPSGGAPAAEAEAKEDDCAD